MCALSFANTCNFSKPIDGGVGAYTETKDAIRIAVWLQMSADLCRRRRRVVLARHRERPSGTPRGTPWGAARFSATLALAVRASAPAAERGLTARCRADCQLPAPAVVRAVCHRAPGQQTRQSSSPPYWILLLLLTH